MGRAGMTLTEALDLSGKKRTAAVHEALTAMANEPLDLLTTLERLKAPARKVVLSALEALAGWPIESVVTVLDETLAEAHDRKSTLWHALMPVVPTSALVIALDHARERRGDNRPLLEAELIHRMGDETNRRLWTVRLEAAASLLTAPGDSGLADLVRQAMGRPKQVRDALERVERARRDVADAAKRAHLDAEQAWVDALTASTLGATDVRPTRALP